MAGLALAACVSPVFAAVNAVQELSWTSWADTLYYFAELSGPNASPSNKYTSLKVHVTAVDTYEIYINGTRIDGVYGTNDGDWRTVDTYNVTLSADTLFIAAKVRNSGAGNGNGIMVDIDTGTDWLGTTTMKRRIAEIDTISVTGVAGVRYQESPVMWYYGDQALFDSVMTTSKLSSVFKMTKWYYPTSTFFVNAANYGFKPVMNGNISSLDFAPDSHIEVVSGYAGDLDVGGGGLRLRKVDGENLALLKSSENTDVFDGDMTSGYSYATTPAKGQHLYVDLERLYRLNKAVIYPAYSGSIQKLPNYSPEAFTIEISRDQNRYEEVGAILDVGVSNADNGGYNYAEVSFPEQTARYVRYVITANRENVSENPIIGEMVVYGTGYTYEGSYTSPWFDCGSAATVKNFDTVTWDGTVPGGCTVKIQTRTVSADGDTSGWTSGDTAKSFAFSSPEPALKFQYRIIMRSDDPGKTPALTSFKVSYSTTAQPLLSGRGRVTPNVVPMNVDTTFVYSLSYSLDTGQNIKNLAIAVPTYATVSSIVLQSVTGGVATTVSTLADTTDYTSSSTSDSLLVTFVTPITVVAGTENRLVITFQTRLLSYDHDFTAGVMNSTANDSAGFVEVWEDTDSAQSWTVTASTMLDDVLIDASPRPKVLSPNGDSRNDFAVIGFTLAKITTRVKINIFSTDGKRVRKVCDRSLSPSKYSEYTTDAPGYWDGKDDDGDLVPPGIYIYQIVVDTDGGDKVKTGTVVVAY